jgi:hypothetical protein
MCKGNFHDSPDNLVLCEHHEGFVHHGCCIATCSQDGKPCMHAVKEYNIKEK